MDKRSRYSASIRDRTPSIGVGDTARSSKENFISEFLKYSEEYNVDPLPVLLIKGTIDIRTTRFSSRQSREVSICILDALNTTMQKYKTITVLKLPNCGINAFGVMQIAEMLTSIGCLRDLNLDMNPNGQENFHLLCQPTGKLLFLTLRHCQITDNGVKKIANELQYRDPPNDPKLISLSLSNNHITCNGAAYIGSMLRTNRSLTSISLLANRICDEGAWLIIRELKMITLTHEEIMDLRRRKFQQLASLDELMEKRGNMEINNSMGERKRNSKSLSRRSSSRRSKKSSVDIPIGTRNGGSWLQNLESAQKKKLSIACQMHHPFRIESYPINGMIVATGNLELQYLDLSYNYLTKYTVRDMIKCLYYQNFMLLGDTTKGLLHVLLEGGDFEKEDNLNWTTFNELLDIRRNGDYLTNDTFQDLVPEESKILRGKIITLEDDAEFANKT